MLHLYAVCTKMGKICSIKLPTIGLALLGDGQVK